MEEREGPQGPLPRAPRLRWAAGLRTVEPLCEMTVFYHASICEGGLESRNSVRPSVCPFVRLSHAWIVTNLNGALQTF